MTLWPLLGLPTGGAALPTSYTPIEVRDVADRVEDE
jgi:hypothetical protein